MSVVAPPPKPRKHSTKGDAPAAPVANESNTKDGGTHQAGPSDLVTANFKVDAQFKQDLKMFAAMHKMSMVDVLRKGFALLKAEKEGK